MFTCIKCGNSGGTVDFLSAHTCQPTPTVVYAIYCEGRTIFASSDYDAVFERRASIERLDSCGEPHPIVSGRFVAGVR